jgi:hypothetical protein
MLLLCSCVAVASAVALLYALFDVNYFVRIAFTVGYARLFQKKIRALDSSRIYGKQHCVVLKGRGMSPRTIHEKKLHQYGMSTPPSVILPLHVQKKKKKDVPQRVRLDDEC